jgi:hypothetical protein
LKDLFSDQSITGSWGPSLNWPILNYGRLVNGIRVQDARFQELVAAYQNQVLKANQEVEDGLVQFLRSQEQAAAQRRAVDAARESVELVLIQYREGKVDFNRVYLLERNLVEEQNRLAEAQGNVVLGLVYVYRALGGGWQIRLECNPQCGDGPAAPGGETPLPADQLPAPRLLSSEPQADTQQTVVRLPAPGPADSAKPAGVPQTKK